MWGQPKRQKKTKINDRIQLWMIRFRELIIYLSEKRKRAQLDAKNLYFFIKSGK